MIPPIITTTTDIIEGSQSLIKFGGDGLKVAFIVALMTGYIDALKTTG